MLAIESTMARPMLPTSAYLPRTLILCTLFAITAAASSQELPNHQARTIEPTLVRVNIITEVRGINNAVEVNGKKLTGYSPIIIQVFSSTGIVLDHEDHIMTFLGYHWIDIQDRIPRIEITARGQQKWNGRLLGIDQTNGVAVIKILDAKLKTTPICSQCEIKDGTTVMAPVKGDPTLSHFREAQVLSVGTGQGMTNPRGWIMTVNRPLPDIGQPILSSDHRVLGFIASQDHMGAQNIVYPISQLLSSAEKIIQAGGDIRAGWLGVFLADSLPASDSRVLIQSVEPDSPAQNAGLSSNDLLLKYNGQEIKSNRQFIQLVQSTPIGSKVDLQIIRMGESMTVTALIEERRPEQFRRKLAFNLPVPPGPPAGELVSNTPPNIPRPLVGLDTIMLTQALANALQLSEQSGLLVVDVARQMPADLAGVRVGDVIVAMDGQPITDAQKFSTYLQSPNWGAQLVLRVSRKGIERTIVVQLPDLGR